MSRRLPALLLTCALTISGLATLVTAVRADAAVTTSVNLRPTPASPQSGGSAKLVGQVSPVAANRLVQLQILRSGTWHHFADIRTDSKGDYAYSFPVKTLGSRTYRSIAPATAGYSTGTSASRSLTVVAKPKSTFKNATATVSGTRQVEQTLTAIRGTWSPRPSVYRYRWRRDGVKISGATGKTYVLAPADYGTHITVEVSAVRGKYVTYRESTTQSTVLPGTMSPATPTIIGTAEIGDPLTAQAGRWTPEPDSFAYQWRRDQHPIPNATSASYTPQPADADAELSVSVVGRKSAFESATISSAPVTVAEPPPPAVSHQTFGELIKPASTTVVPSSVATATFSATPPAWFDHDTLVRWDTPGAFTHSLTPLPYGTLANAIYGYGNGTQIDLRSSATAAEYHLNSSAFKNSDVRFTVTGKKFAIRYWTLKYSDAMVWIDGQPVSSQSIEGSDPAKTGRWNWIVINRTSSAPAVVRFAGPPFFTGVDFDSDEPVTVTDAPAFTLGVMSDSYFESNTEPGTMDKAAAPELSTLTGFRVWNLAEAATGYINDGTGVAATGGQGYPGNLSSPYGSSRRMESIASAPINALLVNGSINDAAWTPDQQRDAVDAFLDEVAAVRPDLPVVLVTLEPLTIWHDPDQTDARYRALNENLLGMPARHSNVVGVIDPYTADWLTGSGNTASPQGDGNQDEYVGADQAHLTAAGQAYYQARIVAALKPMLAELNR